MGAQMTFKRYELKYLLSREQKKAVLAAMEPYMSIDEYGRACIRNIYLDTDDWRLVRSSLEKPVYKEKLRLRSYQPAGHGDRIYVELKKKYKGIVYKRRLSMMEEIVMESLKYGIPLPEDSQISREIEYFREFYATLSPKVFLSYEREAYYMRDGGDFRVTIDESIQYREEELRLGAPVYGTPLLMPGQSLMELKCSGSIPLWMCKALTEAGIYKTSFSKYGVAYRLIEADKAGGRRKYA